MDLTLSEVADLLNLPIKTVERWVEGKKIPAYQINDQYRFSKIEIEEWMMHHQLGKLHGSSPFKARGIKEANPASSKVTGGSKQFCLYRALHKGVVLQQVPGATKREIIDTTTHALAKNLQLDADVLTDLLMDREELQPTALGNGIAVPHTRDFLLNRHHDVVAIAFPKEPIDYGALDGEPVHTLFFLFASDDKRHLHLLAKIAHLSSQPESLQMLQSQPNKEALLDYVKEWESQIRKNEED